MYYSIIEPGGLCNQLNLLYTLYNKYDDIEKIYDPYFTSLVGNGYQLVDGKMGGSEYKYFNIESKMCDEKFYNNNIDKFTHLTDYISNGRNLNEVKFNDLRLKSYYNDIVLNILKKYEDYDLISVHIRNSDYKSFHNGLFFFNADDYMTACYNKINDWKLDKYKILIFSDEIQSIKDENVILIYEQTNFESPIDLFLMSNCNYFIGTFSTFNIIANEMSRCNNKNKGNFFLK